MQKIQNYQIQTITQEEITLEELAELGKDENAGVEFDDGFAHVIRRI